MKCVCCGFESKNGVKTQDGFFCINDFSNPHLWVIPRKQSDFALGKIKLDQRHNPFSRSTNFENYAFRKITKTRIKIDLEKFNGIQKTLGVEKIEAE